MIPIAKSLTLEKMNGLDNKDDEVTEISLLTQLLRKMYLSDRKVSKLLVSIMRGQDNILESLKNDEEVDL